MFSHVVVGTNDLPRAMAFYDAVFSSLDYHERQRKPASCVYLSADGFFKVAKPINGHPATVGNGGTIGFNCSSPELVRRWHAAGIANGGEGIEDPPGLRNSDMGKLYLAYLRDPDGNKLCAFHSVVQIPVYRSRSLAASGQSRKVSTTSFAPIDSQG